MPSRNIVARELAELFKVLGHPDRVRLIEELRDGHSDVNSLADALGLSASRISQHLALLRAHRFVREERNGRQHVYSLTQPEMAGWIIDGLDFLGGRMNALSPSDLDEARNLWSHAPPDPPH